MKSLLLLLAVGTLPVETAVYDKVDVIELNHFYDDQGHLIWDQVIFWEWEGNEYRVISWRLAKSLYQIPTYNYSIGLWQTVWMDGEIIRCVYAGYYRETWTQYDPELYDREFKLKSARRGLTATTLPKQDEQNVGPLNFP